MRVRQGHVSPASNESLRILIIDDDDVFSEIIAKALENAMPAAVVSMATDGFSGGMLASSFAPDVIFLDLRIPGLDGFQTCWLIKGG